MRLSQSVLECAGIDGKGKVMSRKAAMKEKDEAAKAAAEAPVA